MEIDTEGDLLCHSESIPSMTNNTIFYDGRDIIGTVVISNSRNSHGTILAILN